VITVLGVDFATLMSGVVLTETVFNWPGLGRLAVEAIFRLDIPVVMGTVLFSGGVVVAVKLVVGLLYPSIDPRIGRPAAGETPPAPGR
jgi:peptide/nickel transport system permease protein